MVITYDACKPIIEWDAQRKLKCPEHLWSGPDEILYRYVAAGDKRYRYHHVNHERPNGLADKVDAGGESNWATNYNPTDRIVMVAHGNPTNGAVTVIGGKVTGEIPASTVAKDAIAAGYGESKNKVELSICGSGVGGKNSFAQKVANELAARTGVKPDVAAPDGNTASPSFKNDTTGAIRSGPLTGAVDPKTKGTTGEIKHFTAEPGKNLKKDQ